MPRTATSQIIGIFLFTALLSLGGLLLFSTHRSSPEPTPRAASTLVSKPAAARTFLTSTTPARPVLAEPPALDAGAVAAKPGVVRERVVPAVEVIPGLAAFPAGAPWSHFSPRAATLRLFPDVAITARVDESRYDGVCLARTWNVDGSEHGFVASSASGKNMQWFVTDSSGSDYTVDVDALGVATVREMDAPALGDCGGHFRTEGSEDEALGVAAMGEPAGSDPTPNAASQGAWATPIPQPLCLPDETLEGTSIVSILFVYSESAMRALGDEETLQNRCNLAVIISNKDLANSRVPFRYTRAGFLLLENYTSRWRLIDDMEKAFSGDSHAALIETKRSEVRADLVSLISRAPGEQEYIGYAAHGGVGVPAPKYRARSALRWDAILWAASHEFGHNVGGLHHERAIEGTAGEQERGGAFGYVTPAVKENPLDLAVFRGTVMAYGGTRIHQFSNPAVLYDGVPTGLPAGHPQAANAAHALTVGAAKVSAYEPEVGRVHLDHAALTLEIAPGMKIEEGIHVYNESSEAISLTIDSGGAAWLEAPKTLSIAAHASATLYCRIDADAGKLSAPSTADIRFLREGEEQIRLALTARPVAVELDWPHGPPVVELSSTGDVRRSFRLFPDFVAEPDSFVSVHGLPEGLETLPAQRAASNSWIELRAARGTRVAGGVYPLTVRYDAGGQVRFFRVNLEVKDIGELEVETSRGEFVNLSTRGWVGQGDEVMIAGVVICGGPVKLLARAVGPGLAEFGVKGVLQDPALQVFQKDRLIAGNDDWQLDPDAEEIREMSGQVGAMLGTEREAALLLDLQPGAYTFHVFDPSGGTGVGMVELFLLDDSEGRMMNLSTRAAVRDGEDALVAGFVRVGDDALVLARGVGPALRALGVEKAVIDPALTMFRGGEQQAFNDDWSASALGARDSRHVFDEVGAFSLPDGSADASEVLHVVEGATTLQIHGRNGEGGVAVVEVYEME